MHVAVPGMALVASGEDRLELLLITDRSTACFLRGHAQDRNRCPSYCDYSLAAPASRAVGKSSR
jgi:hypothetical protein